MSSTALVFNPDELEGSTQPQRLWPDMFNDAGQPIEEPMEHPKFTGNIRDYVGLDCTVEGRTKQQEALNGSTDYEIP